MSFWHWPRGLQATALSAVLLALFGWQGRDELAAASRRVGMGLEEKNGRLQVLRVVANAPAQQAGVQVGDRILQVAGRDVRTFSDYDKVARGFRRGVEVQVLVEREGEVLALGVRPGLPLDLWRLGLNGGAALLYLLLAILALKAPGDDPRRQPLVLFSFAVALELALPGFPFGPPALAMAREVVFYFLTGWQLSLDLTLVSLIPRRASWLVQRPRLMRSFTRLGMAVGAGLTLVFLLFREESAPLGLPGTWSTALLNFTLLPSWAAVVVWLLTLQIRQAPSPLARQQALLVMLGTLPWALYVVVSDAVQLLGVELPLWADYVQSLSLLAFPLAVFVAVFRYQFLDFELLVRRSLVYTGLTGSLVLLFYAFVGAGSALFSEWIGGGASVLLVSAATLLLGLLFSPLRSFLQRLIDERFFPERYAQRQRLVQLTGELPSFGKVQPMAGYLVERVSEIFGCRAATLMVRDPGSELLVTTASTEVGQATEFQSTFLLASSDPAVAMLAQGGSPLPASELAAMSGAMAQRVSFFRAGWVVPVLGPRGLVGLLLLGPPDVDLGVEELELLSLLAHHVGAVLENARLFEAATVDGLTGLWRREVVLEHLDREWQRAQRYGRPLAIGMADVDLFKPINDLHGHLAGDAVLKLVAATLVQGLRSSDFVGRYGGEEFLLVFPETDALGAKQVAEKLRQQVEKAVVKLDTGQQLKVTISLGVAAFVPQAEDAPRDLMQLVQRADACLLRAKENGRNRVEM